MDIDFAYKNKIRLTTADTLEELLKIKTIAPRMKILWRIAIKEENTDSLACSFSNKFGDDINTIADAEIRFK